MKSTIGGAIAAVVLVLVVVCGASAQDKSQASAKHQFKIGVLPFADNTGTGGEEIGVTVGRAVQAELSHSTSLVGKVLKLGEGQTVGDLDSDVAVEAGRNGKVDVVLVGTILTAESNESSTGAQAPSIYGQSVGARARKVSASVSLQGDLYNVADGKKIDSIRVTGSSSDTKVGADVSTDLGSITTDGASLESSPIGKALQKAVADLVKRVNAAQGKMTTAISN